MAFTAPVYGVANIQGLDNLAQDQATAVKVLFDKTGADTKTYIIALLAELAKTTAGSSAAENLGSATITGITGNTVYAQIANLLAIAQAAQAGTILPGTITEAMLAFTTATQDELDVVSGDVTTVSNNLTTHSDLTTHKGGLIYAYKNLGGGL